MARKKSIPPDSITDIDTLIIISRACQSVVTGSPPAETFDLTDLLAASNRCLAVAVAYPDNRVKYLTGSLACEAVARGVRINQSFWLAKSHEFWMNGFAVEKGKG